MLFGVTSPKMSTMIVMAMVETVGPLSPNAFDKQNGGERRRTDVDDVVSHQNGGDELVVIIHELIGELCALVAVIGQVFEPDTVERRKRVSVAEK